ncbi:cytochrome c family protein [uncultured Hoeflea sp.]|uniref:c-type cytochrome n=1 Tax=uncultured Hoeflea sp. TaxID=538666 RepID=UPI0030D89BFC|tara:strand:+ start:2305 stop:2958 length:654 start_codon:yes stop_codon:yes gene_type:complete
MNSSYFNSAAGAFLGILFVVMTLSIVSEGIYDAHEPETEGFAIEVAESSGDAGAPAEEAAPELIAPLLASADPAKGEAVFKKCAACHTNDASNANKVGPGLWNIVNRPVAAHDDFKYSAAMTEFSEGGSVAWDYEHLSNFLAAPKKYIKGTAMGFAGLKKIDERADLIAYLRTVGDTPAPLPEATETAAEPAATEPAAEPAAMEPAAEPAETPAPSE